ncbi:NADH:flavin oxidoreductase [Streptomyces sp. SP17BM10]|uniref:NADH:flavin oxidoreductase n=1 Tax=Streptomyces sp. SP17BM10 TaxID=3002530 RepID=UPI002E75C3EC|nr:NADH:flavin oxidoreductase [Streptomyces sp. SP17BM10]MEE1784157.1 NADH:flavin oxidoreductase [Streptomyces sp. SP17BM10]
MRTADPVSAAAAPLFTPFRMGSLTLENRIVMAPMTRELSPGGVPGADVAAYYARRAEHGVGLIITEGAAIDHPGAESRSAVPRLHGGEALAGWARVVGAVHGAGGRIAAQLMHVGLDPLLWGMPRERALAAVPDGFPLTSPSGIDPSRAADTGSGPATGRIMTENDIQEIIDAYARAARDARRIGFDAVELHAAHGYLIDQFLWATTNRRADRYGGDLTGRTRFAVEVVRACRRAVGAHVPIILRISQWKVGHYTARIADDPDQLALLLGPLADAGVDVFHCSTRRFWQPEFEGAPLNLAGWVKKVTGRPTITVGSVGLRDSDFLTYLDGKGARPDDVDQVAERLAKGEFDLVAVGRALLADPAWPVKVRAGRLGELVDFSAGMLDTLD